jgi:hypothetical protein
MRLTFSEENTGKMAETVQAIMPMNPPRSLIDQKPAAVLVGFKIHGPSQQWISTSMVRLQ